MVRRLPHLALTYAQKLTLLAALPLIVAVAMIAVLVALQSRALAEREISLLENQLIEAKKAELRNYVTQARNGFYFIYGNAAPDDDAAKAQVAQILSAMIFGEEGQFFVYDYDGNALVSPRQTERINTNHSGETDQPARKPGAACDFDSDETTTVRSANRASSKGDAKAPE